MASRNSTSRSRSRSSTSSSGSSDTTMLDAPSQAPTQPRRASHPPSERTSTKDAAFSLLLSLPRELRDRIYQYALTSPFPFWWPNPAPMKHHVTLGLLTVSRQVYEEAAPVLYAGNKFLFMHPSDCNMFRVVASPKYSALISSVYFRIREKDLRLWTSYLSSKTVERSLRCDLPKLKSLWIFLRCGTVGQLGGPMAGLPPALAAQVQAAQQALVQQVAALQNAITVVGQGPAALQQNGNDHGNNQNMPPPPPPAPVMPAFAQAPFGQAHGHHAPHHYHPHPPPGQPHTHGVQNNPPNPSPLAQHMAQHMAQQHAQLHHPHGPFYASFLRWERELGLENVCLSLKETRPVEADVKVVCIMRLPKPEVVRLCRLYPEELSVDRNGDARTSFRKLHGVDVSLEISGFDMGG